MINPLLRADPPADPQLEGVFAELLRIDPTGERWAAVIRHTYDMIYNGQETGRYRWGQLMKTEKTHFGTLFEINAQRAFKFEGGDTTDFRIAGHQVDAKWSQSMGGWMLPPEVFNELALVASADDAASVWSLGLVRVRDEYRREGTNRDKKSSLNTFGKLAVRWLWRSAPLPPNVLLQLPEAVVRHIFASPFGTQRTNRLFREAEGMIVNRNTVATVSQQLDHQKRVRYNGGSRSALAPEGIIILSGMYHAHLAEPLDVPVPAPNEYVSVRVVPSEDERGTVIDSSRWRRAKADETSPHHAPRIPEPGAREE